MRGYWIASLIAVLGLAAGWTQLSFPAPAMAHEWKVPADAGELANPVAMNEDSIQRGQEAYVKSCQICHGPQAHGKGMAAASLNPKPADLVKSLQSHSDGDIFWKVMKGRLPMPSFQGQLEDREVWDIINFIKSKQE